MIEVETVDAASTIRLLESIEALYPVLVKEIDPAPPGCLWRPIRDILHTSRRRTFIARPIMAETDYAILQPKHLGQRRLLALDGGGIRGLVTLGMNQ